MADIQKGFTFTTGAPDNVVTAAKLNQLADNAVILEAFYTAKTEKTSALAANDLLLVWDSTSSTFKKIKATNAIPALAVIGSTRGLIIKNNGANPTFTLDVTADEVILKTTTGLSRVVSGLSVTPNITNAGANGLDTGAEAASTWYHIWAISDGTTNASLLSLSSTTPTLPGSYTYKTLLGALYNNAGANFDTMYQLDRMVWVNAPLLFTNLNVVTAGTYQSISGTAGKTVALTTLVPPIAKTIYGSIGGMSVRTALAVAADANGLGQQIINGNGDTACLTYIGGSNFRLPLKTSQDFFWTAGNNGAGFQARCNIAGYEV